MAIERYLLESGSPDRILNENGSDLLLLESSYSTTFLEPGGDADFLVGTTNGFWSSLSGSPAIATDFVHGGHIKSISYPVNATSFVKKSNIVGDSGSRVSAYFYFNALPSANSRFFSIKDTGGTVVFGVKMTSAGVLYLADSAGNQIGSNGQTLSTGTWYRISLAYSLSSTTVNTIKMYVDGTISITNTNYTFGSISTTDLSIGNEQANLTLDFRSSDHYADNSAGLNDTGNIWVTAKRPNANGTTNGFTTQIGAGGSGYGSGHSPQVNERALSTTNGWSIVGAGSAVTEEYNIESSSTGDIDISTATIIDYVGWVSAKALAAETVNIIINGVNFSQALSTTITVYTKVAGSSTYPAGTGVDIGVQTDTALTTTSLYECGIIVAYIPGSASTGVSGSLLMMGLGI